MEGREFLGKCCMLVFINIFGCNNILSFDRRFSGNNGKRCILFRYIPMSRLDENYIFMGRTLLVIVHVGCAKRSYINILFVL